MLNASESCQKCICRDTLLLALPTLKSHVSSQPTEGLESVSVSPPGRTSWLDRVTLATLAHTSRIKVLLIIVEGKHELNFLKNQGFPWKLLAIQVQSSSLFRILA